jgi:CheY-like chemotaxis protein
MQSVIFEAFARGDRGPTRRQGGTSLGLAICSKLVRLMDNPVNQMSAKRAPEKFSHSVAQTTNGVSAVEACRMESFDLILMDLQMPEMDGFEATGLIREAERASGRHTPIIAMTAHAMHGDRDQCIHACMDDYISKPVDLRALARTIERYGTPAVAAEPRGQARGFGYCQHRKSTTEPAKRPTLFGSVQDSGLP